MARIYSMALKDLLLLSRDKMGAFFILGFPILMGLFFGLMMGSPGGSNSGKMKIAIVDQDQSVISTKFVESLRNESSLQIEVADFESARDSVRKGDRTAMIVLTAGFGKTAGVFWETPPTIQIGADPSRAAEAAMLQGYVMEGIGELVSERFSDTKSLKDSIERQQATIIDNPEIEPSQKLLFGSFFGSVTAMLENLDTLPDQESDDPATNRPMAGGFNFVDIQPIDVSQQIDPSSFEGQLKKIRSQWDISFPQAMMWGVLGCVAGFSISIARERSQGTMVRLLCAPVSRFEILAGKALACFLAVVAVITLLTVLGMLLGMKPASLMWLAVAAFCVATCFVGIMMTMSLLGKTEQSVAGAGWAINMVMAMLGGAMIPVMFMPAVVQQFSILSPIKWGILALEGAIWRQFTWSEMLLPCSVLLTVGAIGFFVGMTLLKRSD